MYHALSSELGFADDVCAPQKGTLFYHSLQLFPPLALSSEFQNDALNTEVVDDVGMPLKK